LAVQFRNIHGLTEMKLSHEPLIPLSITYIRQFMGALIKESWKKSVIQMATLLVVIVCVR